ncbi:hypothetical protein HN51_040147 [Arachis hypogaea]|uniref:Uncharacterized protein n=1 Tax=Arachis hypogaea TaxID=3818 RepID=A0A444YMG9_ARAHY|nr:DEAD-box ATP-dependent RNA helicase [Arachis hypogaea]RYR03140.1 hypothetical protein Ahy_B06g081980 [Arachis hypogaea]
MKEDMELVFEICVVVPKREAILKGDEDFDCGNVFAKELKNAGLVVERVIGNSDEFFKCRQELLQAREKHKEEQVIALKHSMQSGMEQVMKEQAQMREEMAYQYKLGNFEAAATIQRRLDPDAAL